MDTALHTPHQHILLGLSGPEEPLFFFFQALWKISRV